MSDQLTSWRQSLPAATQARAPIVVFNKSHSGSRLLASLLSEAGIYMGRVVNESVDSEEILRLVEYLVETYYPDYRCLWKTDCDDPGLSALVTDVFDKHLGDHPGPWGWKLCETAYILPFVDHLFPEAKYVHIIRDGRDVAFSDHVSPHNAFWKKIYFNTDAIHRWRGRKLNHANYRRRSYVYNAVHWVNSVTIGRAYGSMLRERYFEVRYEDLCRDFVTTASRLFRDLGVTVDDSILASFSRRIHADSIGKHRSQPWFRRKSVMRIIEPTLASLGYLDTGHAESRG